MCSTPILRAQRMFMQSRTLSVGCWANGGLALLAKVFQRLMFSTWTSEQAPACSCTCLTRTVSRVAGTLPAGHCDSALKFIANIANYSNFLHRPPAVFD